ncbi:MAG: condensation domain-containing protein, partial [Flammeovirgaceae bacterium]
MASDLRIPVVKFDCPVTDGGDSQEEALALVKSEIIKPFDLDHGPMIKACVVRYASDHHIFALIVHQIVADGFSLSLIQHEVKQLYQGMASGKTVSLPAPSTFSTYVESLKDLKHRQEYRDTVSFWVSEWVTPLDVTFKRDPFQRVSMAAQSYVNFTMEGPLYQSVKAYSRKNQSTPFPVLLSAFFSLVSKMTGKKEILVGVPSIGQLLYDNAVMVGQCMQMLPLRWIAAGNESFASIVNTIKDKVNDGQTHRNISFTDIFEQAASLGKPCYAPHVRFVFNMDPPISSPEDDQLTASSHGESGFAKYDLFVNLVEVNGRLHFSFQYNTSLFTRNDIELWITQYQSLLLHFMIGTQHPLDNGEYKGLSSDALEAKEKATSWRELVRGCAEFTGIRFHEGPLNWNNLCKSASALAASLRVTGKSETLIFVASDIGEGLRAAIASE